MDDEDQPELESTVSAEEQQPLTDPPEDDQAEHEFESSSNLAPADTTAKPSEELAAPNSEQIIAPQVVLEPAAIDTPVEELPGDGDRQEQKTVDDVEDTIRSQDNGRRSKTSQEGKGSDKPSPVSIPVLSPNRQFRVQTAQIMYKRAARVIQDPTKPLVYRPCQSKQWRGSSVGMYIGPDKEVAPTERQRLLYYKDKHEIENETGWNPNPTATIPMRARVWKPMSWLGKRNIHDDFEERERRDLDYRDHKMAMELGYETLVGNLLYINIPGGRDINRSWKNFLSPDELEWGFPYFKGNVDKPGMKQPQPYLAHQVKEKLWKFPKTRIFQAQHED